MTDTVNLSRKNDAEQWKLQPIRMKIGKNIKMLEQKSPTWDAVCTFRMIISVSLTGHDRNNSFNILLFI